MYARLNIYNSTSSVANPTIYSPAMQNFCGHWLWKPSVFEEINNGYSFKFA